jgi:peptidoglycan hydrolase CwlO-like protein
MTWTQRTFAVMLGALYVVLAVSVVGAAFIWLQPKSADQYKDFGVIAGIALTADAALVGLIGSFFTLGVQIQAAKDSAANNEKILKRVEDHKKELSAEIVNLQGVISRQNDFLSKTVDAKSGAYNKLFVASNIWYRELQKLADGKFDKKRLNEVEEQLYEAEAMSANLDDADREIALNIVQAVFNIQDEVEKLESEGENLKKHRVAVWNKYAKSFGEDIRALRDRSPFYRRAL